MELNKRISDWIDAHRDELIADVSALVAVKSVRSDPRPGMPFGEGCARALDTALEICARHGFSAKNYDNYAGTADLNDKAPMLDILAHLDVVGEGDGWDTDPYTATLKDDGCIYGRGTDDDKGPLVAALYAMRCVKELGLPMKYNTRLVMGTDEESGSGDLEYYFSKEKSAPNTFSPDASFPVYNTEKGGYKPTFTQKWDATEAVPRVVHFDGGYRINVLPANAKALVSGLGASDILPLISETAEKMNVKLSVSDKDGLTEISVSGSNAHASTPDEGNNGITALIALLGLLPLADCGSTRALEALGVMFPHGDGLGKALGIAQRDDISGELTVAFSLLTMSDTGVSGRFDSRVPICADDDNCRKVVEDEMRKYGFDCRGEMEKPHHTPEDTPFVQSLLRCYEAYTGEKGQCLSMGGGTYVHDIEGGVAFGAGFPGFVSNLHSANERASVDSLLKSAKIFAAVIADMCMERD